MWGSFDGKNNGLQSCLHLGTYKYATLCDKGSFLGVIKIEGITKTEIILEFPVGLNIITGVLKTSTK